MGLLIPGSWVRAPRWAILFTFSPRYLNVKVVATLSPRIHFVISIEQHVCRRFGAPSTHQAARYTGQVRSLVALRAAPVTRAQLVSPTWLRSTASLLDYTNAGFGIRAPMIRFRRRPGQLRRHIMLAERPTASTIQWTSAGPYSSGRLEASLASSSALIPGQTAVYRSSPQTGVLGGRRCLSVMTTDQERSLRPAASSAVACPPAPHVVGARTARESVQRTTRRSSGCESSFRRPVASDTGGIIGQRGQVPLGCSPPRVVRGCAAGSSPMMSRRWTRESSTHSVMATSDAPPLGSRARPASQEPTGPASDRHPSGVSPDCR